MDKLSFLSLSGPCWRRCAKGMGADSARKRRKRSGVAHVCAWHKAASAPPCLTHALALCSTASAVTAHVLQQGYNTHSTLVHMQAWAISLAPPRSRSTITLRWG